MILSRIVDREILPKLHGIHKDHLEVGQPDTRKLAEFLLDDPARFQAEIMQHSLSGTPWSILAAEMLAPVARDLGMMWEEDLCDFLDVTEAMGRLRSVLRDAIGPQIGHAPARSGCHILLTNAPGETHTYGLCHAAGLLRDAGWTTALVDGTGPDPLTPLLTALAETRYDVLGLSLACDTHSPALRRAMPAIRRASLNPALRVVVGGSLVARGGADPSTWGADACLTDPALLTSVQPAV